MVTKIGHKIVHCLRKGSLKHVKKIKPKGVFSSAESTVEVSPVPPTLEIANTSRAERRNN